jgi:hypothetical protein
MHVEMHFLFGIIYIIQRFFFLLQRSGRQKWSVVTIHQLMVLTVIASSRWLHISFRRRIGLN